MMRRELSQSSRQWIWTIEHAWEDTHIEGRNVQLSETKCKIQNVWLLSLIIVSRQLYVRPPVLSKLIFVVKLSVLFGSWHDVPVVPWQAPSDSFCLSPPFFCNNRQLCLRNMTTVEAANWPSSRQQKQASCFRMCSRLYTWALFCRQNNAGWCVSIYARWHTQTHTASSSHTKTHTHTQICSRMQLFVVMRRLLCCCLYLLVWVFCPCVVWHEWVGEWTILMYVALTYTDNSIQFNSILYFISHRAIQLFSIKLSMPSINCTESLVVFIYIIHDYAFVDARGKMFNSFQFSI